ncbi:MAG: histidine kinase [Bacteroidota bacterium]
MKKLFIHHPLFRLLSPLFSGTVVYLLILLIHNNVGQLQEQFLGEELYVCIGLSFIIQEFSRGLLLIFNMILKKTHFLTALILQVITSLVLCIILVTTTLSLYYKYVLGFSPISEELWLFNSIFCSVTFIYILLHISHQYLHKVNTKRLDNELLRRQMVEDDFTQFRNGINPDLLFSSFEALIVLIRKQDTDAVDDLMDHLAATYRYLLSQKSRQLTVIEEELGALSHLANLLNYLPFRNVFIESSITSSFLCVPGSFLQLLELIVRSTIRSSGPVLTIALTEDEEMVNMKYHHNDRIDQPFGSSDIEEVRRVYHIYSDHAIVITTDKKTRTIRVPKLKTKP